MIRKILILILAPLLVSCDSSPRPHFWGKLKEEAEPAGVILARREDSPPKIVLARYPTSRFNIFTIDLDQDGTSDFIVESKTEKQTCFLKSNLVAKSCEEMNLSLMDGFAYEFFVSQGKGKMLVLIELAGDEDNTDYALWTFDPKTWKRKKVSEIYPLVDSISSDRKGIYDGYPWDIKRLPVKVINGETAIKATFEHLLDEMPFSSDDNDDSTRGPAILFEGVATQRGSTGEYEQMRNDLRFMPLSRIVQIARRDPVSTNTGIKIFSEYEGGGEAWRLSLNTRPHEAENGTIRADIVVGSEGCSGSFTGTGKIDGNAVSLRPLEAKNDEICSVTLTFSENGRKVNMKELDCHHAHGRMCEFSGSLKRKK